MSASVLGRVVGHTIELDAPVAQLEGKRVRVTVEVVEPDADEHPAVTAWRDAPPDERAMTAEEQRAIQAARQDPRRYTTDEIRAKISTRHG